VNPLRRALCVALSAAAIPLLGPAARAQVLKPPPGKQPERFRGQIARVEGASITLRTREGTVRLGLSDQVSIFNLSKGSFGEVDFGVYVGSISEKMGDHIYSPIVRDSLSWLHRGLELRIIDEKLRGIAVGHTTWDRTAKSVMTHGWVDDLEERVISIKYGPTEEEETDVEVGRNIPVLKMSLGDRGLIRPGARVFAGAEKGPGGEYAAVYLFASKDSIVPPL
jgi:hypothetical protein